VCTNSPIPFRCLLIEDDPDHAFLISRALGQTPRPVAVDHIDTGREALSHLQDLARRGAPLPDLILLDLNLSDLGGHDLLRRIKADDALAPTPVVVLTTSKADSDRSRAYRRHANGYLVKPAESDGFHRLAEAVVGFWGLWNQPPPRREPGHDTLPRAEKERPSHGATPDE